MILKGMKALLEYVWVDGTGGVRSKNKIIDIDPAVGLSIKTIPSWSFDGSSTGQADTSFSDVILKPVDWYIDPFQTEAVAEMIKINPSLTGTQAFIILCDTWTVSKSLEEKLRNVHIETDGKREVVIDDHCLVPHFSNHRVKCLLEHERTKKVEPWFGFEQEYLLTDRDRKPLGWYSKGRPTADKSSKIQSSTPSEGSFSASKSYCSIGGDRNFGRWIVEEHRNMCLKMGLKICGTNTEVMPSQHEYQMGPSDPITAADELIISRYVLLRVAEKYELTASFDPKPKEGWNGSGGHTNFSTKAMREPPQEHQPFVEAKDEGTERILKRGGIEEIKQAISLLEKNHLEHIKDGGYGIGNERRLTGHHETAPFGVFSWGVANRGCSVRISPETFTRGYGYFEDRRPAANFDPYRVITRMLKTVAE